MTATLAIALAGCAVGGFNRYSDVDRAPDSVESQDDTSDIVLGMSMKQVIDAWGTPQTVEQAGDSSAGNERWTYYDGPINPAWSLGGSRVVYFESGRVAGWHSSGTRPGT